MKELSKKVLVLTVTPSFQNMPKSGLKITSPRYLLPKDLAEAAELSVSTIKEPIKWKTAIYLLIFSGMRRGEFMGLEWFDIDFENKVIHIKRTSQYVQHMGIITKSPRNETSYRTVKLSEFMFDLIREYQQYWLKLRSDMLDRWCHFITLKLQSPFQIKPKTESRITQSKLPFILKASFYYIKNFSQKSGKS